MRVLKMLCCAAALAAFVAPAAHADEWNKLTYFTFSGPVQIPNATLPAGTYTFKMADVLGNRHIVQIYNKEQTKLYATIMAIPNDRGVDNEADKPIVMFSETAAGQPTAVKAWFYPGRRIGDEFVYPKEQAMKIAKAYHKPVLATEADMSKADDKDAWKSARVGHVDESGRMTADNDRDSASSDTAVADRSNAHAAPVAGAEQTGTTARNEAADRNSRANSTRDRSQMNRRTDNSGAAVGTSGQNAGNDADNARGRRARQLPKTASPMGLFALLSGLALAGGLGVRRVRARLAPNA